MATYKRHELKNSYGNVCDKVVLHMLAKIHIKHSNHLRHNSVFQNWVNINIIKTLIITTKLFYINKGAKSKANFKITLLYCKSFLMNKNVFRVTLSIWEVSKMGRKAIR